MSKERHVATAPIRVVDFFSGCGGTSAGMQAAGLEIAAAVDNDPDAAATYKQNFPDVQFFERDIRGLQPSELVDVLTRRDEGPILFTACAPCQPFSRQNGRRSHQDARSTLLLEFLRFVRNWHPDYIFMENVPGLRTEPTGGRAFDTCLRSLRAQRYFVKHGVVDCRTYGVPQRRERLLIIASRHGPIEFPAATHGDGVAPFPTVWDTIGDLPPIEAGGSHPTVPNHRAAGLSSLNLERIRATPPESGRKSWPARLRLECHTRAGVAYSDVYGRLRKQDVAPGLTTRCVSLSNGRFGHPEQDRAISVREAACLQTFRRDFLFQGSLAAMARQIGNAVPPLLAEQFGRAFQEHAKFVRQNRDNPAGTLA